MITKIINIYHKRPIFKSLNFLVFNIPTLEYKGTIDFFKICLSVISKLTVALELDLSNLGLVKLSKT
jgi:hypothetical protein